MNILIIIVLLVMASMLTVYILDLLFTSKDERRQRQVDIREYRIREHVRRHGVKVVVERKNHGPMPILFVDDKDKI